MSDDVLTDCPHCGKANNRLAMMVRQGDRAVAADDGDVSICASCGKWGVFDGRRLRKPSGMESAEIQNDEQCRILTQAWRDWHEERQGNEDHRAVPDA